MAVVSQIKAFVGKLAIACLKRKKVASQEKSYRITLVIKKLCRQ
jgi:hypothetical protein